MKRNSATTPGPEPEFACRQNAMNRAIEFSANHPEPECRVLRIGGESQFIKGLDDILSSRNCFLEHACGSADALRHLRRASHDVVITDPTTSIEEDLALLSELQAVRPGIPVILLAPASTPEEIIAALRARAFLVKSAPFDLEEIAEYAVRATSVADSAPAIEVLSAHRNWVALRANCEKLTAERVVAFLAQLQTRLAEGPREQLMMAFREVLMNAVEHGAKFHASKLVEVVAVQTQRAAVFYVRDPGSGFSWYAIPHAAVSNPPGDPVAHMAMRESLGIRPGGFGILTVRGIVDELIYNEVGNEVLLIKHTA